jgi:hypothetical protein
MSAELALSLGGERVQVFPLLYNKVNKTSGTYTDVTAVYCAEVGNLSVLWPDNANPATIACVAGDVFSVQTATSVTVSSGTFHLM